MKKVLLLTTLTMVAIGGYLHATGPKEDNPDVDVKEEVTVENRRHDAANVMVAESAENDEVSVSKKKNKKNKKKDTR